MTALTASPAITLADALPLRRARTALLVLGGALLTAAAAQVQVPLPFTPVPVTGQTFAVLLAGAALGMRRGAAAQALYLLLGAVGLPIYADGAGGWQAATGATAGYLVGFVLAGALTGALAERQLDRRVTTALPAMLAGSAVIYMTGVVWLSIHLQVSLVAAVSLGLTPFLIGDVVKLMAAGLLLPAVWKLVGTGPETDA